MQVFVKRKRKRSCKHISTGGSEGRGERRERGVRDDIREVTYPLLLSLPSSFLPPFFPPLFPPFFPPFFPLPSLPPLDFKILQLETFQTWADVLL